MANASAARVLPPPFFTPSDVLQQTHALPRVACAGWPAPLCSRFAVPPTTSVPLLLAGSPYYAGALTPAFVLVGVGALFSLLSLLFATCLCACPRLATGGCGRLGGGGGGAPS